MLKKKSRFRYKCVTKIIFILGIIMIISSQIPYGYDVFTDILMAIGTGCISGCILLLVPGIKEREKFELDKKLKVTIEVQKIIKELFYWIYEIPRDDTQRENLYEVNEIEMACKVYEWFCKGTVLVTKLACNNEYKNFISKITNEKIDVENWFEDLNYKTQKINEKPICTQESAEELYKYSCHYFEMIKELHMILIKVKYRMQYDKESIEKSII